MYWMAAGVSLSGFWDQNRNLRPIHFKPPTMWSFAHFAALTIFDFALTVLPF